MESIFFYLFIAVLIIIALYFILRKLNGGESNGESEQNKSRSTQDPAPASNTAKPLPASDVNKTKQIPPANDYEVIQLRQQLNTIVLHNNRLYQNNIEIARRDFIKRGLSNPSETELLKRAIEIWQDDNR